MMSPVTILCNSSYNDRKFIKSLPDYNSVANIMGSRQLAKKTRRTCNLTLVLDLDETLIFSTSDCKIPYDFKISFKDCNDEESVNSR